MINPTISVNLANRRGEYEHMEVQPLTGAIGAVVKGVDLRSPSDAVVSEILDAMDNHLALFFEDQDLSVEDQEALTLRFGAMGEEPFVNGLPGHAKVIRLLKEADEKSAVSYGGAWHTDWSFLEAPPSYSVLYAKDIPPYGGDTLFSNTRLAYESLSEPMRVLLEPLVGIHSASVFAPDRAAEYFGKMENMDIKGDRDIQALADREHSIVRTHPRTGRKAIFVSPGYTIGIKGMRKWEYTPLLEFLFTYCTDPLFSCRYRWRPGTLAMWDNRCTLHRLIIDYLGFRREMYRTTVKGEVPL